MNRCTSWDSALGTSDFYHCNYYAWSTLGNYGIPSTGDGVAGVIAAVPGPWTQPNRGFYGETFKGSLLDVLEPGATYEIKADFLYNMVTMPPPGNCLEIGFYFFKNSNPPLPLPGQPFDNPYRAHVGLNATLVPVGSYGTFTFTYVPDSCYEGVMIGLFSIDSTWGTTCYNTGGTHYFDIDNISMVKVAQAPQRITTATVSNEDICVDDCIDFNGISNLPVESWTWNFPGANTTTSNDQNPTGICYPATGDFDYSLITTYECGSDTIIQSQRIHVDKVPVVNIANDSASVTCFGKELILEAESDGIVTWNDGTTGNNLSTTLPGNYIATASNQCGTASDSVTVEFENCPCELFIPNAFTPDQDGKNDLFSAAGECVFQDFRLEIFNRWGQLVYTSNDVNGTWDGRYNGEVCPQGVYAVSLSWSGYRDFRKIRVKQAGRLALLR
jgi:gliding motility-associated-like protein